MFLGPLTSVGIELMRPASSRLSVGRLLRLVRPQAYPQLNASFVKILVLCLSGGRVSGELDQGLPSENHIVRYCRLGFRPVGAEGRQF
jgi:hypothetical protein